MAQGSRRTRRGSPAAGAEATAPGGRGARRVGRGRYDRSKTAAERHAEQRQALIAAATEVLARKGLAGASVEAILSRAELSRATFYAHFGGLEDLLLALYDDANAAFARTLEQRFRSVGDPVERLRTGVADYLALLASNAAVAIVVNREIRALGSAEFARREAARARFVALLLEGVAAAHARGLVPNPPDELLAYAVVCAVEGVGMRYVERGDAEHAPEATDRLVTLALGAFGGRTEPSGP